MTTTGLDLHKRESQLCVAHQDGRIEERRITTRRERFTAVLGTLPHKRILLEASTESEWIARQLESMGHEVIAADPNFAPMCAARTRRVKTDRRDAYTLMEACRLGAYRKAHRATDERRHMRAQLGVREALVRTRTRYTAIINRSRAATACASSAIRLTCSSRKSRRSSLPHSCSKNYNRFSTCSFRLNTQIDAADERITQPDARCWGLQCRLSPRPFSGQNANKYRDSEYRDVGREAGREIGTQTTTLPTP